MWLDRFSNASTPTSNTPARVYSPSPRKSIPSSRNGLGVGLDRVGSNTPLDLASPASSNVSLPLPPRRTTGSALRQEQRPPPDVENPVNVLRSILRHTENGQQEIEQRKRGTSLDGAEISFGGLSLQEYAENVSIGENNIHEPRIQIKNTKAERQKYEDFDSSITEIESMLNSVETYLTTFKSELGQVSAEIENLQSRSVQLNAQLDNRRKVEKLLGPAVEQISLSPVTVRAIADGPIDETFAKSLTEIEARSLSVQGKSQEIGKSKAVEDVKPLLEDLKLKAIERIRDYFVAQIKALRSPNINAQVIQQGMLLKHKELFPYLSRNHPQLAEDIAQAYANTMRWYYLSNFTRYLTALNKIQLFSSEASDLLGSDPSTARKPVAAPRSGTVAPGSGPIQHHDPFSLGRRIDVLRSKDQRALPSHLAEDTKTTHFLEIPFRNFNLVLLDNLTAEYTVCTDLFSTQTYHQVSKRVAEIFEPTFHLGHQLTKALLEKTGSSSATGTTSSTGLGGGSTDCLSILLCIRLNQSFAFEAQRRKLPVMDDYINYTNILLWPRFQKGMDLHVESLRKYAAQLSASGSGGGGARSAAFALIGGGAGGGGGAGSGASLAPHFITQRFGQFLHGILSLSIDSSDEAAAEPVANSLARLRAEYETLITKMAKNVAGAGSGSAGADKRARFCFNNYSLVLTIIGDTKGKLAEEAKEWIGGLVGEFSGR